MRILTIQHEPSAGLGVFADAIQAAGAEVETWSPAGGERAPSFDHDAVITLGGAMNVDEQDAYPWIVDELALLTACLERRVPVLGVCLGAQMLAAAGGGRVARASQPEIGWYRVQMSVQPAGDPLLAGLEPGFHALEWHSYEFSLPPRATPLARSQNCLQAFRVGARAWGIQFHAEVTLESFEAWIHGYRDDADAIATGVGPEELLRHTQARIEAWNALGRGLCARFLDVAGSV